MYTHSLRVIPKRGNSRPQPGESYIWQRDVWCRDGNTMKAGSRLEILEVTTETPYDEIGPYGYNLVCMTCNGVTVWSTVELCVDRGLLVKAS
jgi:hypothetical protein